MKLCFQATHLTVKKGAADERFEEQRSNFEKLEKIFKQMEKHLKKLEESLKGEVQPSPSSVFLIHWFFIIIIIRLHTNIARDEHCHDWVRIS